MSLKDLKGRSLRAGVTRIGAQGANFILRLGGLMVLARLLDPKEFGLVGMVTAATGVFSIFKDAGLSMVTIQRPTITNEEVSTLFWLNILVGLVLAVLSVAMAPILVRFYHEPALFWVTVALAIGFIFNGAGVQHAALLQRNMRFGALSLIELVAQLVSTAIGIGMALGAYGYWALVGMTVSQPAVFTSMVLLTGAWVPGMPHRKVEVRSMVRFGGIATLNSLVVYVAYNFEKVLLGRIWGAEALGIYGRAYQLLNIPSENLNSATGGVLFSALSRLQDDPVRLKSYFLKSYSLLLSLTLPSTIACGLFADDIVYLVLGPSWAEAVILFRLLTPAVLVFALINPMYWLLVAIGRPGRSLKIALVIAPLVIVGYVLGLPYGPSGVALGYSVAMTLWLIPHLMWCVYGTMISLRDLFRAVQRPLVSATVAGAVAYLAQLLYAEVAPPLPRLLFSGCILLLVHFWMLLFVMGQKAQYLDVLRGLKGEFSNTETTS